MKNSYNILELQLRRALGEDPYAVLCRDPARLSAELRNILGSELDNLLKIAAIRLADNYSLEKLDMHTSLRSIDKVFLDLLFEAARRAVERIAPGDICLTPREAEVISRLLEPASAGGIDERVGGKVGWAIKIKIIIILGIRFGDKIIPVALYSRKYGDSTRSREDGSKNHHRSLRQLLRGQEPRIYSSTPSPRYFVE